ncbi:BofC C-terminal domain-containing protein [Kitasatospora viridis]|uniref:Serine/threonine protein phosphatase PstP n=1 Tax=Kitasatospora viridis TaxID=281105 RepID=A0A561UHE0_9ACTN|nr:BofC C-terminal domain-containing protein [Kitasatospora viridis]TWF98781.1 serine/threonine protein phosphatase PrpC [Kitasatospora viridis]
MSLVLRFAAGSHKGLIREGNEDSGYAGPRLLAVADGMGGAAAGEVASSEVLSSLIALDDADPHADLLTLLHDAVQTANDRLRLMVEQDPQLEGMGCTLTALLWTGDRMGLVHVGDSRAYLLRDGSLSQITQDHTWVQRLVDEGRITAEEAETHPQRSLLMRALDGRGQVEPDLSIREVRAGDRYLICSDGLSGPVSHQTLEETLGSFYAPEPTIQELIQLALRGGGPDNITCIVADVLDVGPSDTLSGQFATTPVVVGAVAEGPHGTAVDNQIIDTPAGRAAGLGRQQPPQGAFGPANGYDQAPGFGPAEGYSAEGYPVEGGYDGYGNPENYPAEGYGEAYEQPAGYPQGQPEYGAAPAGAPQGYPAEQPGEPAPEPPRKRRWFRRSAITVVALGLLAGAGFAGWTWNQDHYYLAVNDGKVAVYQGQKLAGLDLSSLKQQTDVQAKLLSTAQQQQLGQTIKVNGMDAVNQQLNTFQAQATVCAKVAAQPAAAGQAQAQAVPTQAPASPAAFLTPTSKSAPKVGASPAGPSPSATPSPAAPSTGTPADAGQSPTAAPAPSAPALSPDEQKLEANCPPPS